MLLRGERCFAVRAGADKISQADYPALIYTSDALETCPSCGSPKLAALKHTDFLLQADPVSSLTAWPLQ